MEVLQAWRQGTLRAGGATALGPAVIVAAAAVIALGGGLGGLGSLGQLFSGPALPESSTGVNNRGAGTARPTAVRIPLLAAVPATPATPGAGGAGAGSGRSGTGRGTEPVSGPGTEGGGSPAGGGPSTGIPGGGGSTPGGGAAPAPPATPPSPLTQVGDTVKQIAAPLPEPVRSTTDRVVDTVTGAAGPALGRR